MSTYDNDTKNNDMFTLVDEQPQNAIIKVFGCGGGGGNAVKHMLERNVEGSIHFEIQNLGWNEKVETVV